jgi:hypothetical protein
VAKFPNWRRRPVFPLGPFHTPPGEPVEPVERLATEDDIDAGDGSTEARTAKGEAIHWTEADIGEMGVVSATDVDEARDDWKSKTLPGYGELIDATAEPDEDEDS